MHSQKRINKRHNGASEFEASVARSLPQLECVYVWIGWKRSWQTHSALGSITECSMHESDSSLLCADVKPCRYWHSKTLSGDYLLCIFSIAQNIFMVVKDQTIFFFHFYRHAPFYGILCYRKKYPCLGPSSSRKAGRLN